MSGVCRSRSGARIYATTAVLHGRFDTETVLAELMDPSRRTTVVSLVVLGILAAIIRRQQLNGVDAAITPYLHGFASPALDVAMEAATFVGSDPVLLALLGVALATLIFLRRPWREGLFLRRCAGRQHRPQSGVEARLRACSPAT